MFCSLSLSLLLVTLYLCCVDARGSPTRWCDVHRSTHALILDLFVTSSGVCVRACICVLLCVFGCLSVCVCLCFAVLVRLFLCFSVRLCALVLVRTCVCVCVRACVFLPLNRKYARKPQRLSLFGPVRTRQVCCCVRVGDHQRHHGLHLREIVRTDPAHGTLSQEDEVRMNAVCVCVLCAACCVLL